jgi:hypothetical protein
MATAALETEASKAMAKTDVRCTEDPPKKAYTILAIGAEPRLLPP